MAETRGHVISYFLSWWILISEGGRTLLQPVFTLAQHLLGTVASLSFSKALATKADVAAWD